MSPERFTKRDAERRQYFWQVEHELIDGGTRMIAGVDEAGRGPLAGPVVVAAVVLPIDSWFAGLNDSKKVQQHVRERLFDEICLEAVAYAIEVVPVEIIDELNILQATYSGMRAAIHALSVRPDVALIDGLPIVDPPVPQYNLVKGDSRSASIAAASILAKVARDRIMEALDAQYPQYGFARHKGYPTAEHLAQLHQYGACAAHRRSFAPVAACLQTTLTLDLS